MRIKILCKDNHFRYFGKVSEYKNREVVDVPFKWVCHHCYKFIYCILIPPKKKLINHTCIARIRELEVKK